MPIPPYIAELRSHIGHALLWLATARTVALDDHGHVILGRYPGSRTWTIPGGVIDPGEHPADAAVRECYEETGIIAIPEALTSVTVSGLVTHDGGDLTQHLDITFRCLAAGGQASARRRRIPGRALAPHERTARPARLRPGHTHPGTPRRRPARLHLLRYPGVRPKHVNLGSSETRPLTVSPSDCSRHSDGLR
jgi:8-oxo-dGTP pyrophosphatase MutT (NUDIX family)